MERTTVRRLELQSRAGRLRSGLRGNSLARNSGYIMATTVSNAALGFVFWVVAARTDDAHTVGLAGAALSAMSVTSLICTVGADAIVIQALPGRSSGREWSVTLDAALSASAGVTLLGATIAVLLLPALSRQFAVVSGVYAVTFVVGTVAWTISTVLDYTFVAERVSQFMLIRNIMFSVGKLLLLLLSVVLASTTSLAIFGPWVAASWLSVAAGIVVLVPRLRRGYRPALRGIVKHIRQLLSGLVGHHVINMSGAIPPLILPILVATRLSPADNAYFYTTWMVGSVFFMVSPAVSSALFAEGSHGPRDLVAKARSSARVIATLLAPIAVLYLLAGRTILSLFGSEYASRGWPVLLVLLVSAVPDAVTNIYIAVMRVQRRLAIPGVLNTGIAATSATLAWLLLPSLGIVGAALAWLIAQVAGTVAVIAHLLGTRFRTGRNPPVAPA
jgi:O-antigen/teichoic acid export membrane protein